LKSSKLLWSGLALTALLTTALFIAGFVYAIDQLVFPEPSNVIADPNQPEKDDLAAQDNIRILAFGDSLTRGSGDATGKGYVQNVKELLDGETDKPVNLLGNYAVNGYTTEQVLNDLKTMNEVRRSVSGANLILFTAGGNDLFQFAREEVDPQAFLKRIPETLARLEQILDTVVGLNPKAAIVYIGLYNPFPELDKSGESALAVQQWNHQAFELINGYDNVIFVPTYDLFVRNTDKYLYSDGFHPNELGYARIADRVFKVLE
jgi:lysophospholipase L1-like esterase